MWGIPALIFLIAFFHRVAPGVIAKDLMQDFHASGAIVGLLSSTYFYAYAGFMIPAGVLIDTFGPRWTVATGAAIMGVGTMAMAMASTDGLLFTGRFAVGMGATVTFIGTLKITATWFPISHFGTMSALTATVGILGSLIGTYPLASLVAAAGWRGGFWLIGMGTVGLSVLCALAVRDRPRGSAEALLPLPTLSEVVVGMFDVLQNRHTWPPFLAFFCWYAGMGNLLLWVVPYLRDVYGLPTTGAAFYATAISLALLVSGPLTGFLSDHVLKRRKLPYAVLTGCFLLLWILFVATLGALTLRGVYALFFAMGLVGGAFVLTWPIGREVNPPNLAGIAVAVVNLGGFLGAALTQWPLGAVLDSHWAGQTLDGARVYPLAAYRVVFMLCAVAVLAALGFALLLRETRGRNVHTELGPAIRSPRSPAA